jgi:hypothetical protein
MYKLDEFEMTIGSKNHCQAAESCTVVSLTRYSFFAGSFGQ